MVHEEEVKLFRPVRADDRKAPARFVEKNLRLVVSIAKRHTMDRVCHLRRRPVEGCPEVRPCPRLQVLDLRHLVDTMGCREGYHEQGLHDPGISDMPDEVFQTLEAEHLKEQARYVLVRRHGLDGRDLATLAELSRDLGLLKEWVRDLQRSTERVLTWRG